MKDLVVFLQLVIGHGILIYKCISRLLSKCNIMMGMVKCSVGYKAPTKVTSYLYCTLVRSNNLERCSTVWSPFNFNEMQALESIQRAATL